MSTPTRTRVWTHREVDDAAVEALLSRRLKHHQVHAVDRREAVRQLLRAGYNGREIAERLGMKWDTINHLAYRHNLRSAA